MSNFKDIKRAPMDFFVTGQMQMLQKIIATQEMFLNDIVNSKLAPRTGSKVGLVKSKQTRFFLIKFKSTVDGLGPSLPLLINLIIF